MRLSMKPSMSVPVSPSWLSGRAFSTWYAPLSQAILVGVIVAGDGRSHWFKGVQLITLYLVIALMFYFLPMSH